MAREMAENNCTDTSSRTQLLGPDADDRNGDVESGRPKEPWKGEFVRSVVYAGLDSIVTCFSLISSISAGHLSSGNLRPQHYKRLINLSCRL